MSEVIANVLASFQSIGVFIGVLSILILVHEWGHFITAKRLGVKVEEFALGFGPTLFSRVFNDTKYMLKAIPLGGYVKMAGDERENCKGTPEEFYSKSPGHRALIVLNGPVVNFILAYLSFAIVFMLGYPGLSTKILGITKGSPAYVAGLQTGDKIVAINSKKVYGWMNLDARLEGNQRRSITVKVLRNGQEIEKVVVPDIKREPNMLGRLRDVRDIGITGLSNKIGGVGEGYPAGKAGLKEGDQIVAIDDMQIEDWPGLQQAILESKGDQIKVVIVRDGETFTKFVTPKIVEVKDEFGSKKQVRKIGIGPVQELDSFQFGFVDSIINAGELLGSITTLTFESLYRMITGSISAKESVTGPVGIFYIVKGAAEAGISHLIYILGVISASLAIFNLLPVIPLDGGHLLLLGIEKIRGQALPQKVDEWIMRVGFSLIMVLALFVFYSDFARLGWIDKVINFF